MPLAIRMNSTSTVLKRHLNQEEADAITGQVAKKVYLGDIGRSLGFIVGISRVRLTDELRPPKDIPVGSYPKVLLEIIRLKPTTAAMCFGRNFFVVGAWTLGAAFLSDFYSSVVLAYATMSDPRLEEYRQTVQSQDPTQLRKQITEANNKTIELWRKESFRRYRESRGMSTTSQDDASPTGSTMSDYSHSGNYSEGGDTTTQASHSGSYSGTQASTTSNVGVLGDSQTRQQAVQQQQAPSPPYNPSDDTSSSTSFFDDASPTAQVQSESASQPASGSAWARIRQGASGNQSAPNSQGSYRGAPGRQQQPQYENQYDSSPASSTGGSAYGSRASSDFQYSEYERDRQTAKEQAQKEFDRMVDAERSGSDGANELSSGGQLSGRGGAWGR